MFYKEAIIRALEQSGGKGNVGETAVKAGWILNAEKQRPLVHDSMVSLIWDMVDDHELLFVPSAAGIALPKEHVFDD